MGLVLADLTDEQKKELDLKSGVLVEDISGVVRGNLQTGDVITAIIQRGQATEAKSAAQINDLLAKLEKGAPVTFPSAWRGAVLRDAQAAERRVTTPTLTAFAAPGGGARPPWGGPAAG
jgi:hypothetical protein